MSEIEVAGLVTRLSMDDTQLEQSMASLSRQMSIAKSQAQVASSGLHAFGSSSDALKMKSDALSKQLQIQGTRVAKLQQEHAKAVQEKGADAKETQKLEAQLNKAVAEYNRLDAQLQATNRELAIQSSEWTKLGDSLESAGQKLQNTGKKMEGAGKMMTRNVTTPIVATGAAIVKFGSDFEKAMTGSTAIMGDLSEDMQKKMETAAREVAKTTRFSATQAAESYFYLASAGLDAAQSMEALPRVAAFAQAGNFNMARATDLLTDAQSALGLAVEDTAQNMENMTRVSDVLVKANTVANATVEEFSQSLTNKAGAALRLLNKDVEEGVAVLAAWADQGVKGQAAGEQLNIVYRDLQNAALKNKDAFRKFGVEVFDSNGNMRNTADIIENLENALDGMSDAQVRTTLTTMGFQDRSVSALLTLLGTSDAIREYEKELRSAAGMTDEVAAKQIKNLQDQLGLMKDRLIDSALTMYDTLGPTIENVVLPLFDRLLSSIERGVEWFASLDEGTQSMIFRMIAFAAAAGPTLLITGKLVGSVGTLASAAGGAAKLIGIKSAGAGLTAATSAMSTSTAAAAGSTGLLSKGLIGLAGGAGPLALAVAGVAAVGYGAYKLHQHMRQEAIPAVRDFGDEVSDSTKKAIDGFMTLYDEADASLKQLQWSGQTVSKEMKDSLTGNFNEMSAQIVASLEDSRKEGTAALHKLFAETTDISEKEQKALLESLEEGYDEQIATVEEKNARILEIINTASKEKRAITKEEQREIDEINKDMAKTAIATISKSELEMKAIMERQRVDAEAISARQAAEVVKNSQNQKEKSIIEADEQYNEVVKLAILQRDVTGKWSADEADAVIREAKRKRDEVIDHIEEMHDEVIKRAQDQAKEHINAVDWETGEILTFWQKLARGISKAGEGINYRGYTGPGSTIGAHPRTIAASQTTRSPAPSLGTLERYDTGGIVPGPIGKPRLAIVEGGETILPTHKPGYQAKQKVDLTGRLTVQVVNDDGKIIGIAQAAVEDLLRQEVR